MYLIARIHVLTFECGRYLIRRDPAAFWSQATGLPAEEFSQRRVPIATARSFIRSMFMVFPEMKDQYEGDPAQNAMLLGALERLEEASGGFDHDSHGDADGGDGSIFGWVCIFDAVWTRWWNAILNLRIDLSCCDRRV